MATNNKKNIHFNVKVKNGKDYLIPCLETHKPIDLVIIMLGTNDLKKRFSLSAYDIANGAGVLVDVVNKSEAGPSGKPPPILLMAPPPVAKLTEFAEMFEGAEAKTLPSTTVSGIIIRFGFDPIQRFRGLEVLTS